MEIEGIKSDIITPGQGLFESILSSLRGRKLMDKDILVISSKVVAVTQGRVQKISAKEDFINLVCKEADKVFFSKKRARTDLDVMLTLKNGIFIPWAGIDRSNVKAGNAVLWPEVPFEAAFALRKQLQKHYKINHLGVLISDSWIMPLRRGVGAVAIGYAGFTGVNDLVGKKDLFGNKLKVSRQGVADMLAAAAHLVMGESIEQTPFAVIRNAPVRFSAKKIPAGEAIMPADECLFNALYRGKML